MKQTCRGGAFYDLYSYLCSARKQDPPITVFQLACCCVDIVTTCTIPNILCVTILPVCEGLRQARLTCQCTSMSELLHVFPCTQSLCPASLCKPSCDAAIEIVRTHQSRDQCHRYLCVHFHTWQPQNFGHHSESKDSDANILAPEDHRLKIVPFFECYLVLVSSSSTILCRSEHHIGIRSFFAACVRDLCVKNTSSACCMQHIHWRDSESSKVECADPISRSLPWKRCLSKVSVHRKESNGRAKALSCVFKIT